jgi:hypothetical protein
MMDERELTELAVAAQGDDAKINALAQRLQDEGVPPIAAYETIELYAADAEGREAIVT